MAPKGKLIIIGGNENKAIDEKHLMAMKRKECIFQSEILATLIAKKDRAHRIIEIITSASELTEQMEKVYREAYKSGGLLMYNSLG